MDDLGAARLAVCIGGAVIDRKYRARGPLVSGTSNPADGFRRFGGVARNVAENLARLGVATGLMSFVGDDEAGRAILRHTGDSGVDVSRVVTTGAASSAEYAAILSAENELVLGMADMAIFELFTPDYLAELWPSLDGAEWVFADCNLPRETLGRLISDRAGAGFRLAIDAVSAPKAARLPTDLSGIDLLFMNLDEANAMLGRTCDDAREAALGLRDAGARETVVSMGARGIAVAAVDGVTSLAAVAATPIDVTGAGDAMIAGTLHGKLSGQDTLAAARIGALLAALTTETTASVHPDLSACFLRAHMRRIGVCGEGNSTA